jgi:hypothetical protein
MENNESKMYNYDVVMILWSDKLGKLDSDNILLNDTVNNKFFPLINAIFDLSEQYGDNPPIGFVPNSIKNKATIEELDKVYKGYVEIMENSEIKDLIKDIDIGGLFNPDNSLKSSDKFTTVNLTKGKLLFCIIYENDEQLARDLIELILHKSVTKSNLDIIIINYNNPIELYNKYKKVLKGVIDMKSVYNGLQALIEGDYIMCDYNIEDIL